MAVAPKAHQFRANAADRASVIARNFEGDAALYASFSAACSQQFPQDVARGDAACAGGDLAQLGRLAHDLKTALALLGNAHASALAAHTEAQVQARDPAATRLAWQALREILCRDA